MITKGKSKVIFLTSIIILLTFVLFSICFSPIVAHAETIESESEENDNARGIYTKLSLSINAKDGIVTATVKNDFTLGNSVIPVVVELYSSYTFQEYVSNMTLESSNTTTDLDIYKTISTSCSTNGEQKYWCALMRYKHDSADWIEKITPIILLDGDGNVIKT